MPTPPKKPRGQTLDQRVADEIERLRAQLTLGGIDDDRLAFLTPVIENTAWLKIKLDDARKTIRSGRIILKYDNGGGQKGSHVNPAYKAYADLWRAYLQGLDKLMRELPDAAPVPEPEEEPKTVLGFILEKHNDRITDPAAQG